MFHSLGVLPQFHDSRLGAKETAHAGAFRFVPFSLAPNNLSKRFEDLVQNLVAPPKTDRKHTGASFDVYAATIGHRPNGRWKGNNSLPTSPAVGPEPVAILQNQSALAQEGSGGGILRKHGKLGHILT